MVEKILVGKKSDFTEGAMKKVEAQGKAVLFTNIGGVISAINNTCSHRGGPLDEGAIEGEEVTCPWHGAKFNVCSGKVSGDTPWGRDQETFAVVLDGENVYLSI